MTLLKILDPKNNLRISFRFCTIALSFCLFSLFDLPSVAYAQLNPTYSENKNQGTGNWKLNKPADDIDLQIKGYASATSVNKGEEIAFYVSTSPAQSFDIEIYRIGWYNGSGGRLMSQVRSLNGTTQPIPAPDSTTGLLELRWNRSHRLTIPNNWTSGVYLAKLINSSGFDNYITFVVRDDNRSADFLYQQSVTTYQAYNNFPHDQATGKSTYPHNSYGPTTINGKTSAVKVSFDRPYAQDGSGDFFRWEFDLILWMERIGLDVAYSTNIDTHRNGSDLLNHDVFVSTGHDEYWSKEMYDAAEAARDGGTDLAFMGANAAYWQVRFEPSSTGVANRVMVSYKNFALDPEPNQDLRTVTFYSLNRPEQTLRGVQYENFNARDNTDYVVKNRNHWVYDQTELANGDRILNIIGYEVDTYRSSIPLPPNRSYTILAESPFKAKDGSNTAATTALLETPGRSWVFSSGTMSWSNALNAYWHEDSRLQQMTANLFQRFVNSNNAPVITNPGDQDSFENQTISLQINASDPNGLPLTYEAANLPRGLSINSNTGRITGQFEPNRIRDAQVSVTVNNGSESASVFFTWQVNRANAGACRSGLQQAEWGKLFGNFEIGSGGGASGGNYVHIIKGADTQTFNPYDRVEFCFQVPTSGNYQIKTWVKAPNSDSDSFYVTIDGAQPHRWTAKRGNSFQTDYVNSAQDGDPLVVNLSAGNHTVTFHQHEGNVALDRLELELVSGGSTSPPGVVTQLAPQGSIADSSPTFEWRTVDGATVYKLLVRDRNTDELLLNESYSLNQLNCSSNTCSITPSGLTLASASYSWNIQAKNNDEPGPWSGHMDFAIAGLTVPQQISPQGSIADNSPTMTWSKVSAATEYRVLIRNTDTDELMLNETYPLNQLSCNNSNCSIVPPGLTLSAGNYKWNTLAKSNGASSDWSKNMEFTIGDSSALQQIAPQGSTTDGSPTIRWTKVGGATEYKIVIHNADTDELLLNETYPLNQLTCNTNSCSVSPSGFTIPFGNYEWNIQSKSNGTPSPWTGTMGFSIDPLSAPQQIAPDGSITDSSPTVSWEKVSGAIAYKVLIRNTDTDALVLNQRYTLNQLTCNNSTCSVTPSGLSLPSGNFKWNILAENYNGPGTWSDNMRFSIGSVNANSRSSEPEVVPSEMRQEYSTYISAYWN